MSSLKPAESDKPTSIAVAPGAESSPRTGVSQQRTVVSLFALHGLVDCFGGFWPIFKHLAGLDLQVAGMISTVADGLGAATQPLFGMLADRANPRRYVLWGATLTCCLVFLGVIGRHIDTWRGPVGYGLMLAVLLLAKMGQAMFHPAGSSVAGNAVPTRRFTLVALFTAFGTVGFALSQMAFASVYRMTGGYTELLLIPAAALLVWAAAWCRPAGAATGERPRVVASAGAWVTLGRGLAEGWRRVRSARRSLVALYFMLACSSGVNLGLQFLMPELTSARGYPAWLVNGGAVGLLIAGSAAVMVPAGHLADRVGRRRTLAAVLVLSAVFYYLIVCLPPLPTPVFAVLCLVGGGILGTANPLGVALGQHLVPQNQSMISGVMMGLAWALGAVAPWLLGTLAQRPTIGAIGALAWLGVANVIAVGLLVLLRESRHSGQPA